MSTIMIWCYQLLLHPVPYKNKINTKNFFPVNLFNDTFCHLWNCKEILHNWWKCDAIVPEGWFSRICWCHRWICRDSSWFSQCEVRRILMVIKFCLIEYAFSCGNMLFATNANEIRSMTIITIGGNSLQCLTWNTVISSYLSHD